MKRGLRGSCLKFGQEESVSLDEFGGDTFNPDHSRSPISVSGPLFTQLFKSSPIHYPPHPITLPATQEPALQQTSLAPLPVCPFLSISTFPAQAPDAVSIAWAPHGLLTDPPLPLWTPRLLSLVAGASQCK